MCLGKVGNRQRVQATNAQDNERSFVAHSDYAYQSTFFFDPENDLRQPGYGLWNTRIGFESDRWGVYAWGKNLLNSDYRTSALVDGTNGALAIAGDPRTYGLEARYRF